MLLIENIIEDFRNECGAYVNEKELRYVLTKHLEPHKKAEECKHEYLGKTLSGKNICKKCVQPYDGCKHINWNLRPAPFCNDCEQYLLERLEPQQEDKKTIELLEYVLQGERPINTPLTDANMSRIESKINEIILAINKING